jgi:Flp pilus assembly protein TadD
VAGVSFGAFCYERNKLWGSPETLVALAAAEAQHNPRPMLNFADFLIQHDRCDQAVPYLARAERILPNSYFVKASWGRTLACLGRPQQALLVLQQAAAIRPCSQVYEWIGLVYGGMGRLADARAAIQKSVEMDPRSAEAHSALALWYESVHDLDSAELEYRRSLELDPEAAAIRANLQRVAHLKSNPPPDRPRLTSD